MPIVATPPDLSLSSTGTRSVLLKPLITSPLIEVGEHSYYDDPEHALEFEQRNVLYPYGPEKLVIGRYCAIAAQARFIMNGGNHLMLGVSTYPFMILGGEWGRTMDLVADSPSRGDTVVGNDVWIGFGALIMPGVRIGDGAIIGAGAVVAKDVPPYAVVVGNPGRMVKQRYSETDVERLQRIAWWDWSTEKVARNVRTIIAGTPSELESAC